MSNTQPSLLNPSSIKRGEPTQRIPPVVPTEDSTIMHPLSSYTAHLRHTYAKKTVTMYAGDIRQRSVYLTGRPLKDVRTADLEQWRYDPKLWMGVLIESAAYLPK
jgi:hypothetical protein